MKQDLPYLILGILVLLTGFGAIYKHQQRFDAELVAKVPFKDGDIVLIKMNGIKGVITFRGPLQCLVRYSLNSGELVEKSFNYYEIRSTGESIIDPPTTQTPEPAETPRQ